MNRLLKFLLGLIAIAVIAFGLTFSLIALKTIDTEIKYTDIINKYAEEYNADPVMIASIIKVESDFNTDAVSNMNAKGLMQILPDTGEWISERLEEDYHDDWLHDPDYNIKLGTFYYEYLYEHFGTVELALSAYNGGMGNVEGWLSDPNHAFKGDNIEEIPFTETRNYVKKVLDNYDNYQMFYGSELPDEAEFDKKLSLFWKNYKSFVRELAKGF